MRMTTTTYLKARPDLVVAKCTETQRSWSFDRTINQTSLTHWLVTRPDLSKISDSVTCDIEYLNGIICVTSATLGLYY